MSNEYRDSSMGKIQPYKEMLISCNISNELRILIEENNIDDLESHNSKILVNENVFHINIPVVNAKNIVRNRGIVKYLSFLRGENSDIVEDVGNLIESAKNFSIKVNKCETKILDIIHSINEIIYKISNYSEDFFRLLNRNNEEELKNLLKQMQSEDSLNDLQIKLKELEDIGQNTFLSNTNDMGLSKLFSVAQYSNTVPSNDEILFKEKNDRLSEYEKCLKNKASIDSYYEFYKAKLQAAKQYEKSLIELKDYYNNIIKRVNEIKNRRQEIKNKIIIEITDPRKKLSIFERTQKIRKELQEHMLENMKRIREKQSNILESIADTSVLLKKFHSVFILDKSGSMTYHFEDVIKCVQEVLTYRKQESITDEKVSVIKFNSKAVFEIIDANVNGDIILSNEVDGGTSFIEPLKKLDELLEQIESSVYTPIVFFLSDGKGNEPEKFTLNFCNEIKRKHNSFDFMFFTVGFGNDADDETLENMCKIFNYDKSTLKVGNDLIRLHHKANSSEDLKRVFTLYQKLYNYQTNIAQQQIDLLNNFSKSEEKNYNKTLKLLDLDYDSELSQIKKDDDILAKHMNEITRDDDKMEEEHKNRIKDAQDKMGEIESLSDKVQLDMNHITAKIVEIELQKKRTDDEFVIAEKHYNESKKTLDSYIEERNKTLRNSSEKINENREKFLENAVKNAERMGINLEDKSNRDEFKHALSNLQENYFQLMESKSNSWAQLEMIRGVLINLVNVVQILNNKFRNYNTIFAKGKITQNMWNIVRVYCYNKFKNISPQMTDSQVLDEILRQKVEYYEEEREQYKNALKKLLEEYSIESIFIELEDNPDFEKNFLDCVNQMVDKIKDEEKSLEREIKKFEKELDTNEDTNKVDIINKKINALEIEADNLRDKKNDVKDLKNELIKIARIINNLRKEAKEAFHKSVTQNDTKTLLISFFENFVPKMKNITKILEQKAIKSP